MSFSVTAIAVRFDDESPTVTLSNGRELRVPFSRFPVLASATPAQRASVRISHSGNGLHWDELDEDIGVEGLLRDQVQLPAPDRSTGV
jgi:hypothetical protein